MSLRLIVRLEAKVDLLKAARWYESRDHGLGFDVVEEVRAAIQRALDRPQAHMRLRRHPELRRILSKRFPYRIFYIVRPGTLVVIAILHAARHDRHWKRRIRSKADNS